MIVQIAGISTFEDAVAVLQFGGEWIGFTLGLPDGPHDGLTKEIAKDIVYRLPPQPSVLITYNKTEKSIKKLADYLGVKRVQLHGEVKLSEIDKLRKDFEIIQSVNVIDGSSIETALEYDGKVDYILLDSYDSDTKKKGATGKTHDWNISRKIVEECSIPVILAGGLTPENVSYAIAEVRPAGVDVHTGVENPDGSKNHSKMRSFIKNAKSSI